MYIGNSPLYQSFPRDRFNGGAASYTLTYNPQTPSSLLVIVDGVVQDATNDYTTDGTTLTPTTVWPVGTNNVVVIYLGRSASIGTPSDDTVGTNQLQALAVTTAKIDAEAVTEAKVEASVLTKSRPQNGTAQATTSGTSIDFTGIPSWVKKITLSFSGVSTNGTSDLLVQIGDSGGVETTGYLGSAGVIAAASAAAVLHTAGFGLTNSVAAATVFNGRVELSLLDGSTWACSSNLGRSDAAGVHVGAGSKALSAALDRVRLTTFNGTDAFDAGSVNIQYE